MQAQYRLIHFSIQIKIKSNIFVLQQQETHNRYGYTSLFIYCNIIEYLVWIGFGMGVEEGNLLPRMSRQDRENNVPVFHVWPMGVFVSVNGWINEVV